MKAGLTHANKGPDEIDAAMSEKIGELKPAVEKRVGTLVAFANIATLVGLLGTVLGLIHTFGAVAAQGLSQADKQRILANGIAEAMYDAAFGLGITVTSMVAHLVISTRARRTSSTTWTPRRERVFNLLSHQGPPGPADSHWDQGGGAEIMAGVPLSAAQRSKIRHPIGGPGACAPTRGWRARRRRPSSTSS